jgi:trehalose-6-phosphate synthase
MFHYLLEDLKVDMKTQEQNWNAYVSVNQAYADALIGIYQKNDFGNISSNLYLIILTL